MRPANWPDPDRRFLVTSKLQAIAEKKRGGSDVSELRRDYGRRNIVDRRCSRARANVLLHRREAHDANREESSLLRRSGERFRD